MSVVQLQPQVAVVSRVKSSNACVDDIVEFVVSKNKSPKKTRLVEFIFYSFYKTFYIITICDFLFNMLILTYFYMLVYH